MSGLIPEVFVLDVDGVMTTGQFLYSSEGKAFKVFGPDDADGLALLRRFLPIRFITGDHRGFPISERRIHHDMGYELDLVSTTKRVDWLAERYDLARVVFMGDGIFDHLVMRRVGYAIAPQNAHPYAKACAQFITPGAGGQRAVAEACLHLLERFYTPFGPDAAPWR